MQPIPAVAVVQAWLAAANQQDVAQLLALSAADIELIGPRGVGHGHQLLRDWLARAGLTLTTQRIFARAQVVVVAQQGVWRALATGAVVGEATLASLFRVQQGQVVAFARYDALETALDVAQLTVNDELPASTDLIEMFCKQKPGF